jgi:LysR family transcriptional regulator, hydrogen peroxide-inducible genes activator
MTLRDLSYLIALAKLKNFSLAAEHCHVSQPTLSMQIRKLEETLDCQLFERQRQRLLITPAGETALEYAQQIYTLSQDMKNHFKQSKDPLTSQLKLGLFPTLAPYLLPKITPILKKKLPKLTIFLHEIISEQCITRLLNGKLDVILIANKLTDPHLTGTALWTEPFYLATAREYPLPPKKPLTHAQLPIDSLILLDQGHCMREQGLAYCQQIKQQPQLNYQATSLETLLSMVEMNEGVTFIPEIALPHIKQRRIKTYAIKNPPSRTIYMYWRKSLKQPALFKQLTQLLKKPAK